MSNVFLGVNEKPDTDFWPFVQTALLSSLAVTMIYFVASIISDIVRVYMKRRQKDYSISWPTVIQNAFARSLYSFTSSVLLFVILQ